MCFLQRNCYPFFSPFHSSKTRGGERDCPLIRRRSKCEFITTNYACRKSGILRSNLYSCLLSSFQLWMSDWLTLTRRWLRIEVFSFSWFWEFEKIHIRNACLRYGAKKFIDFLPICHVFNSFFALVSVFFLVGSLTTLHVYTRTPTLIGTSITQTGLTSAELSKLSFFFLVCRKRKRTFGFFPALNISKTTNCSQIEGIFGTLLLAITKRPKSNRLFWGYNNQGLRSVQRAVNVDADSSRVNFVLYTQKDMFSNIKIFPVES